MDDHEREAIRAEGPDPDEPAARAASAVYFYKYISVLIRSQSGWSGIKGFEPPDTRGRDASRTPMRSNLLRCDSELGFEPKPNRVGDGLVRPWPRLMKETR
jgi:hypothetical protein